MRLLRCDGADTFSFEEFSGDKEIPSYAILSHTWIDGEEVTYDEMPQGCDKTKSGYNKIRFCAHQAQLDGLKYFWVDTCCINKKDEVELRDALSSMFLWYQNATRCYVFLSDVSSEKRKADNELLEHPWIQQFRGSRWFTRGWTLQELVAPRYVEFFSKEGKKLGDKTSLGQHVHEKTRISELALRGAPMSQFSINERLKWREHRKTTLPEDQAYSMMGILGVSISPFYGEGAGEAFKRLMSEADKLCSCLHDLFLTDPRDDKKRIEDSKGGLLEGSSRWVFNNTEFQQWRNDPESRLLWIKGDPGKGKTMLLCSIINELQTEATTQAAFVSYFFCQATDSRINSASAVLRGLLFLLLHQQLSLTSHVRRKYDYAGKTMFDTANAWITITDIFADILQDLELHAVYLIIDALDECVTDLTKLLDFVVKQSSVSSRIKWIVSSRNWPDIEHHLAKVSQKVPLSLELNKESVSMAVQTFIHEKVSRLAQEKRYNEQIQSAVLEHLLANANDTFLWVALVCKNLDNTAQRHVLRKLKLFPPGLDLLYERMMQQISNSDDSELCKQILAAITLVYRPITLMELVALVEQLEDVVDQLNEIIDLCGSFLTLREGTIYFVHQSAKDFLLENATNEIFPSGTQDAHHTIFTRSLEVLSRTLQRDMYGLKDPGYHIDEVELPDSGDPLAGSRYSCIYWIDHLCEANPMVQSKDLQDRGVVDMFLQKKYLYWLEALSLCKSMSKGVVSMAKLYSLVQVRSHCSDYLLILLIEHRE